MTSECEYLAVRSSRGSAAAGLAEMEPARRREVVEHLRSCSFCRRLVVDEDPTLVFSTIGPEPLAESEVAEIRAAVETLRRSKVIETENGSRSSVGRRAAMVAASLLCALALLPLTGERSREEVEEPMVEILSEQRRDVRPGWPTVVEDRSMPPVIEELNRPGARVYQLTEEDFSVVMIVDETLDL